MKYRNLNNVWLKNVTLAFMVISLSMCSEKSNTESGADTYFTTHFQDDYKPGCQSAVQKVRACRAVRNTCWDKAHNTSLDDATYKKDEAFDDCFNEYLECIGVSEDLCKQRLKAFVLDAKADGKELGLISPELAWDGRGNLGGVLLADRRCQALADKNNLKGTFKAFLSSSQRGFYEELKPEYLNIPLENVLGVELTGNVKTLNDIRDATKNTSDGMWDSVMFFRANKQRIHNCGFYTQSTFDIWTGMNVDGTPSKNNCSDWSSNSRWGADGDYLKGSMAFIFDRGLSDTPIEVVSQTSWKSCSTKIPPFYANSVLSNLNFNASFSYNCDEQFDGLFCVQTEF